MPTVKNPHGLTPMEEKFAVAKAAGMNNLEAREYAGYSPNVNDAGKRVHACRVNAREHVQRRIAELQAAVDAKEILEIEQIQARLTEMALNDENSKNVQLKALDQLARTKGAYSDNVNVKAVAGVSLQEKDELIKELLGE